MYQTKQKLQTIPLYFALLLSINLVISNITHAKPHPAHHAYGTHGMAIFRIAGQWYASHMPLANSIHAHQIIMQIRMTGLNAKNLSANNLISFAPQQFDLHALQRGEITSVKGTLFDGHFERGGKVIADAVTLHVDDILLDEPIDKRSNGKFWRVNIGQKHELLVHQIATTTSYDQLLLISVAQTQQGEVDINHFLPASQTDQPITQQALTTWLQQNNATWIKQLYLETQDFQ